MRMLACGGVGNGVNAMVFGAGVVLDMWNLDAVARCVSG